MKKLFLILMLSIILISPIINAEIQTLGIFEKGGNVSLIQICASCTFNNITSVLYPNSSIAISNVEMTRDGTFYNLTFSNTTTLGSYIVNGFGDLDSVNTVWSYDFEITGTGFELTEGRAIVFIGLLVLLGFLFVVTIGGMAWLPSENRRNEEGMVIEINKLKHVRSVLMVLAWVLLMAMFFIGSNIGFAYLGSTLVANILFEIYQIMMLLTLPFVIIWFLWIFVKVFQDREFKKIIERGVDMEQL